MFFFQFFVGFSGSSLYISQPLDRFLVPSMATKKVKYAARRGLVKPISAQARRSESVVPSAATTAAPGMHWTQYLSSLLPKLEACMDSFLLNLLISCIGCICLTCRDCFGEGEGKGSSGWGGRL